MSTHPELSYVLVTPARNEETYIEKSLGSVTRQTIKPVKWVIVNDGSTDSTGEILRRYAEQYPWIEVVDVPVRSERSFAGKVRAFNRGFERVQKLEWDVVGCLDADVSFDDDYLEFLIGKFGDNPRLGVAGTVFQEEGYNSATDSFEGQNHVAGGCQMFRRECFAEIGGYVPNKAGGIDWIAVTTARMMGWTTRSFREKAFFHYRSLGTAERGVLASAFSYGEKDYYLGGHPVWELARVAYRLGKAPYLLGGAALLLGYSWAFVTRTPRPVSRDLMRFHRSEQMQKLRTILRTIFRFRKLDNFELEAK